MTSNAGTTTLIDRMNDHFTARASEPAFQYKGDVLTWGALDDASGRVARNLVASGIVKGDRIGVLSENSLSYCALIVGILRAGASVVPLPTLVSDEALAKMIDDSGAHLVFASVAQIKAFSGATTTCRAHIVCIDPDKAWEGQSLADFQRPGVQAALPQVSADDEFNIIYSSGTTGRPKGIVHTHKLRADMAVWFGEISIPPGARTLTTTSIYSNWTMGALTYTLWAGGYLEMMGKYSPEALIETCQRFAPHSIFLIPVQIERLIESGLMDGKPPPASMKWTAGSYLAPEHKIALQNWWPGGVSEVYGMTEGAPFTMLLGLKHPDKMHTVGQSNPPEDLKIINDDGNELGFGERGEVVGRARTVMNGYNNAPEAVERILWHDAHGIAYFRSGDIGELDEDRFLTITGRKKDMIISGGLNIYAADVEEIIREHSDVDEVAVIAVPSAKWGESPAAIIVRREGATANEAELLDWTNARLGKAQRIRAVAFTDCLPRGGLGKVLRNVLRDEFRHLGDANAA